MVFVAFSCFSGNFPHPMHFIGGKELTKICTKYVRRTQTKVPTFMILQYTSAMAAMANITGDAAGRLFK